MDIFPYKYIILSLTFLVVTMMLDKIMIFDFNKNSSLSQWTILDDVVMGGRSASTISVNAEGHGVFEGSVSLENNGGFASVRYQGETIEVKQFTKCVIRLKGDGKDYQFRIKSKEQDYYSYINKFSTTGDWQTLEITLDEMTPWFRGRRLDMPNYPGITMASISFLIGNKKAEEFKLLIDRIEIQ
ncbi:CIA30 family protein [Sediminicola sp. 1XM1-17]|uniref:CIA30 family protein n=1 Tax=Sediminicola sp. 1XM1-17 TaxID=3127702 RepID=UPI0030781303